MVKIQFMSINTQNMPNESTVTVKPKLGGWLIAYIILSIPGFFLSLISLFVIFILVIGGLSAASSIDKASQTNKDSLEYEFVDGNKNSGNKLLIYNLKGTIQSGGDGVTLSELQSNIFQDQINKDFKKIKEDSSVKAVLFSMDTPGGEVTAAEEIGDSINDLMQAKNQPKTVFYWGNTVASGGVYITSKSQNNYVVASPYGESGSIGVITRVPDLQGLYDKIGVKWRVYKSAPSKDYGSEARDPSNDENLFIQAQIDKAYNKFVDYVANGRKIDRNKVLSFANGFVYDNQESQKLGLVDELGNLNQAYNKLAKESSLKENDYQVVSLKKKTDLFQDFLSPSAKTNLVGALLGVDTSGLNKQAKLTGNMYFFDPRYLN
jgi:protease-4